jgi:hypothetical protein
MAYRDGLKTGYAGLKHTSDIVTFRFVTVCIAEMCLDSCDAITKSTDGTLNPGVNQSHNRFSPVNVIVGIDMDLHATTSFSSSTITSTLLIRHTQSQQTVATNGA